jgi:hypothetical protein
MTEYEVKELKQLNIVDLDTVIPTRQNDPKAGYVGILRKGKAIFGFKDKILVASVPDMYRLKDQTVSMFTNSNGEVVVEVEE